MANQQDYDKESSWLRLIYMVGFYLIYKISDLVVLILVLLQAVVTLFGRGPNQRLTEFGTSLASYIAQIVRFLSYADEKKPYPFDEWPSHSPDDK